MDRITLTGMRYEGRHGVSEEERRYPQVLEVDLEVEADLSDAARSDRLADTVDYGALIEIARRAVEERSFQLLEAVAGAIADEALRLASRVTAVTVRVRKLGVPVAVDLDHAQVELRRASGRPPEGDG